MFESWVSLSFAFFGCFVKSTTLNPHLLSSTDATTYAHFLFNAFDMDRNGSIRFEDFVIGLSVLLRGSVTEKLNWAFNLYDINKDGYITKEVCVCVRARYVIFLTTRQRQISYSVTFVTSKTV